MRLRVSNLSVTFGIGADQVRALDRLSFETLDGEFVSVIGPSGCGKTTLLRALAGLIRPSDGAIERLPGAHDGLGRMLLVFQEDGVFPWMTVMDNATFGLRMQGVGAREREARAQVLLDRFGLSGRERAYPHQISVGMKQRLAVIRCFLADPAVMLMDEPFAGLDAPTRLTLQEALLDVWEYEKKTVVFVTHDIEEALLLSDRILILGGRPATIVDAVAVPFPRPRHADLTLEHAFLDLKRVLWTLLGGIVPAAP